MTNSDKTFYPLFKKQGQKPMQGNLPELSKMTPQQVTAEIKARVTLLQQAGELPSTEEIVVTDRQRSQRFSYAQQARRLERKGTDAVVTTSYVPPVRKEEQLGFPPRRKSPPLGTLGSRNRDFFEKLKHKQKG